MLKMLQFVSTSVIVLSVASIALGQAGAVSDITAEFITDHHGTTIGSPLSYSISESIPPEPGAITQLFPGLTIDFYEPSAPGSGVPPQISDRLHIDPYQVTVTSDDENPLASRPGAIVIPASANETFLPFSIFVHSDGDGQASESDHLVITVGYYGPGTGAVVLDLLFPETPDPSAEGTPFTILGASYDVLEASLTGVTSVSDYFDHSPITGYFISSDNPADYDPNLIPDGIVIEDGLAADPFYGGDLTYSLGFTSDGNVPEPSSVILLGTGAAAILLLGRRRFLSTRRRS